jgi:hypothetical protein
MGVTANYRRLTAAELEHLQQAPATANALLFDEHAPAHLVLDIDKAWHAIHFLLNDDPWGGDGPLFDAILGGTELDDDGHTRYLTPDVVQAAAETLNEISPEDFIARFDPEALKAADIYPGGWGEADEDDHEYLLDHYQLLQSFFDNAADAGHAILIHIE